MTKPDPRQQFLESLSASLANGTFVRLTLTQPVRPVDGLERVLGRPVDIKGQPHLTLTFRYPTRDITKNLPHPEIVAWVQAQLPDNFRGALLSTTAGDWQLTTKRLIAHKPQTTVAPPRSHDEPKANSLDATAYDWLHGLGIADAAGKVRASMADKYSQITRYLEIVAPLVANAGVIADMGCGKGYLTFGLWHVMRKAPVKVIGVEQRPELVAAGNSLAKRIGATGLEFITGTIATAKLPAVDALIALHACNTATDDAIRRGVTGGAKLIVVAPCCHQEVRPQLGRPEPLTEVLKHGLMAERMAEWVTDALRVLFLEWAGYRTKVIEFVGSEHTPKNLMIVGILEREPFALPAARVRIDQFKAFFGITHHTLDELGRD